MRKTILLSRHLILVAMSIAPLAFTASAKGAEQDEAAIRQAAAEYLEAVNRGDFGAMRAHWSASGDIVDESGRKTAVSEMQTPAASAATEGEIEPLRLSAQTESIRFVTPDVAIEDGTSQLTSPQQGTATRGRYSVVWVRRDGKWVIDAVREAANPEQASENRLQDLQWMIGKWVEQGDGGALQATFSWSPDKNFIVCELRIQPRGQDAHVVTQRIGWDAATGKIRSWNFDSDGGFSEGRWTRAGDGWSIDAAGVLPDGKRTEGRRLLKRIDENSVLLESVGFEIDGEPVPDLRVKLVRQ